MTGKLLIDGVYAGEVTDIRITIPSWLQRIEPYISIFDPRCAYNWQMDRYGNLLWIVFHSETIDDLE